MGESMRVTKGLLKRAGVKSANGLPVNVRALGRRHLPGLTKDWGFTRGAEIGVWKGEFSAQLLEGNPGLHMLCIDPWEAYPEWKDPRNLLDAKASQARMEGIYQKACARLKGLNATIVRKHSIDAAAAVPSRSLDFVYVDANHGYDAVTEDLTIWMPKVKAGGFVAGHDYRVFPNKPMIHVKAAVNDFTKAHAISPWFILSGGGERTPSFLWEVN